MSKTIALIPARSGSTRIKDKNIKPFFDHPLIAYSIHTAIESGRFDEVYVSSDSQEYLNIAEHYGALTILRPDSLADGDMDSWVEHAIDTIPDKIKIFAVLPPTNPFRTVAVIRRAFGEFKASKEMQVKTMERVKQHPDKMFRLEGFPCKAYARGAGQNTSIQELSPTYIQNGCIYISRANQIVFGKTIAPCPTYNYEGFDINTPEDWILAEELVKRGMVELPKIDG